MTTVGIAELKARLREYLQRVRGGERIVVLDGTTPVATLEPWVERAPDIVVLSRPREGAPRFKDLQLHKVSRTMDADEALRSVRDDRALR